MSTPNERLVTAQWILERNLGWVAAAEIKVGAITAVDIAMLAALGAFFSVDPSKSPWAILFGVSAAGALLIALTCTAMVLSPRLSGPSSSLLFFCPIASMTAVDYCNELHRATHDQLLADFSQQIHRNAEIANAKHAWVKKCLFLSLFAVLPWVATIGLLVKAQLGA